MERKGEDIIAVSIEKTPGACGGDACIGNSRIPVWMLEQARRLGFSKTDMLKSHPGLGDAELEAAWAYLAAHREEIESAIRANESA